MNSAGNGIIAQLQSRDGADDRRSSLRAVAIELAGHGMRGEQPAFLDES